MVSVFKENIPAANSSLQSAEIRGNFEALYDKLRTLEVQATDPVSTSLLVLGGPVYFRSSTNNQLKLIKFNTKILDLTTTFGYKTKKDGYGSLYRELQSFRGLSAFQTEGLILEIAIFISPSGQLTFTESLSAQSNRLSSPFNIYFDDSEIPIALLFVEKNGEGVLQVIRQTDVTDIRPVITSAFQNNTQSATIENQVQDNTTRIDTIETSLGIVDSLRVRLVPTAKLTADGTTSSNTRVEALSGSAWIGSISTKLLKFAGAYIDFSPAAIASTGVVPASTPVGVTGQWNRGIVYLEYDPLSTDSTNNSKIGVVHGTAASEPRYIIDAYATLPANSIPLSYVLYKYNTSTTLRPLISQKDMATNNSNISDRIGFELPIVNLTASILSTEVFVDLTIDVSELLPYYANTAALGSATTSTYFKVNDNIDMIDSNTKSIRRVIYSSVFNSGTLTVKVITNNSFGELSLLRNPKARSVKHTPIVDDLRPFIGIS